MENMSRGQEELIGANEEIQPEYPPQVHDTGTVAFR
jgi:hypothetical protein